MIPAIGTLLTAIAALATVLALIIFAARLARRGSFIALPAAERELAVQEAISLDSRRRLYLVRCGERHALLLTGGPQDVVVGWLARQSPGDND
jgi:flagellar protein FliO/FliZ